MNAKPSSETYLLDINAIGHVFSAQYVGWVSSTGPLGTLLLSLTSGWTKDLRRHCLVITWEAILWSGAIIGFGFSTNRWLAL